MSNEKQNNSWKGKLDEMEQLPDAAFSKAAAWEKLYSRLDEKPRRKKAVWYVAAAACLLLVAVASWMALHTKTNKSPLVKKPSAPMQTVTAPVANVSEPATKPLQQPIIIKPIDPNSIKMEPIVIGKTVKERNIPTYLSRTYKKSLPVLPAIVAVTSQAATSITAIPTLPPVASFTVAAAPPKKKLKVVHVNELDNSIEDEVKMAKSANWHYFQVKFNSRDPFTEPVPETPQRTNDIKIKLPPQN